MRYRGRFCACVVVLVTLSLFSACTANAQDPFRAEVVDAANKIITVMGNVGAESIQVKPFTDKTTFGATVLVGIKQLLEHELSTRGVALKQENGAIGVSGELSIAKNLDSSEPNQKQLRIQFQLTDRFGDPLDSSDGVFDYSPSISDEIVEPSFRVEKGAISQRFASPDALLVGFGANADLDRYTPRQNNDSHLKPLIDSIDNPTSVIVRGDTAKASGNSPFGLRVVTNGRAKPLRSVDGRPFVDFRIDETFAVEILNDSDQTIKATLSLDGLNSFYKSHEPEMHGDSWVAKPRQPISVIGFYLDSLTAGQFKATTFKNSERARAGLGETPIGAITVAIHEAVPVEQRVATKTVTQTYTVSVPVVEDGTSGASQAPDIYIDGSEEVEQSVGPPVAVRTGKLRAVISIRYRHPESRY